jgi:hypothetical protein
MRLAGLLQDREAALAQLRGEMDRAKVEFTRQLSDIRKGNRVIEQQLRSLESTPRGSTVST